MGLNRNESVFGLLILHLYYITSVKIAQSPKISRIIIVTKSTVTDKSGWCYGCLASLKEDKRVYGDVDKDAQGTATFTVPENTEYL